MGAPSRDLVDRIPGMSLYMVRFTRLGVILGFEDEGNLWLVSPGLARAASPRAAEVEAEVRDALAGMLPRLVQAIARVDDGVLQLELSGGTILEVPAQHTVETDARALPGAVANAPARSGGPRSSLESLVGVTLTAVELVQDYLMLRFGKMSLTALVWPTVSRGEATWRYREPGFVAALCDRLGSTVRAARQGCGALNLDFGDGARMRISLLPEDAVGPEAAILQASDGSCEVW